MGEDEYVGCPSCHAMSELDEVLAYNGCCPFCGVRNHELDERYTDPYHYYGSRQAALRTGSKMRRTADDNGSFMETPKPKGDGGGGKANGGGMFNSPFSSSPGKGNLVDAIGGYAGGGAMTGQEETPAFNPGPQAPGAGLFSGGSAADTGFGVPIQGGDARLVINGDPASGLRDWNHPGAGPLDGQKTTQPAQPSGGGAVLNAPGMDGYSQGKADAQPGATSYGSGKLGPVTSSLRVAAIDFIAGENVTDRGELLFRAHRHASNMTCRMPVPVAQRVVREFVAAVNREIAAASKSDFEGEPCEDCGAEAGEKCRPWCTGEAKYDDEQAEKKRKKSHRTASVIADFPDELMF